MKVTTRESLARDAVARAKAQPRNMFAWAVRLRELPDDATPAQVDAAVGHGAQTAMWCNECGTREAQLLVEVGEPPGTFCGFPVYADPEMIAGWTVEVGPL